MAYRYGDDKNQMVFLPPSIEDYVSKNDPVRVYDAFVEALDLTKLGIEVNPSKVGNKQNDTKNNNGGSAGKKFKIQFLPEIIFYKPS